MKDIKFLLVCIVLLLCIQTGMQIGSYISLYGWD